MMAKSVFHSRISLTNTRAVFPIERFRFWRSQVPQNTISATTCHLANFRTVLQAKKVLGIFYSSRGWFFRAHQRKLRVFEV